MVTKTNNTDFTVFSKELSEMNCRNCLFDRKELLMQINSVATGQNSVIVEGNSSISKPHGVGELRESPGVLRPSCYDSKGPRLQLLVTWPPPGHSLASLTSSGFMKKEGTRLSL